jgi:hypothetical protein
MAILLAAPVLSGCPRCDCGKGELATANVQLTPFSGRFGYGLSGPYGFEGSLAKNQLSDAAWRLEASFTFPTGGYTVDAPVILVAESYPEQVSVSINVTPPAPGAIVTQVVTEVPVTADITASNGALFNIRVTGAGIEYCPDAVQVTPKNADDAAVLEAGNTAPRLLITSPSGIGEATAQLNAACPLKKMLVGLRYEPNRPFTRQEGFEVIAENGKRWASFGACPCLGFIQIELPEAALAPENGTLTLRWVDMYRQ